MASNENLIDLMDSFDSSEPLLAGYSSANLSNVSKKLNSKDQQERSGVKVPAKIKALVKIVRKCVDNINVNLISKYPNAKPFNVENNITYNSLGATGKFEIISSGNSIHLSFNIKKLSKLPSLEVYSIITKAVVDALSKQNNKSNDDEFIKNILRDPGADSKKENQKETDVGIAKSIIAAYLKSYLPAVYTDDFKKFDNISEYVAGLIVKELSEKDLKSILSPFFDLETLEIDKLANSKVDAFLGRARRTRLYGKATELLEDPSKEAVSLAYEQQAQYLLGMDTSDPDYHHLAKKYEAIGTSGERCLTGPAVKEFCLYYVKNFLHASNIKNINVTFEPKGALGSYIDAGATQSININLKKLEKMGSFTELAMTLSHELTHAVDSTKNKTQGIYNENGGGLIGDIDNDISGSGAKGEVKALLVDLKSFCYHINPNERHARLGELSALIFMQEVGATDRKVKAEIYTSVQKYIKYQQKTINMIKELPQKISEFSRLRQEFLNSGKLESGSIADKMIQERIDYLISNKDGLSFDDEVKSQETARSINEGTFNLANELKQQEEMKRKQKEQELEEIERQL